MVQQQTLVYDWVLIFTHGASDDELKERTHVIKAVKAAGLVPVVAKSQYTSSLEVHVWLRCPADRLEEEAERMQVKKRLQEHGGLAPFCTAKRHLFEGPIGDYSFFSSAERQQLIFSILTSSNSLNGAGLELESLKASGYLIEAMPLHDFTHRDRLISQWLEQPLYMYDQQPITEIKDYFGEEVALYFAWAGHFVRAFFPLAFLGLITQIAQSIIKGRDIDQHSTHAMGEQANSSLNVITAIYSFIMHVFIAVYSYTWARRQYNLAHQWGVIDMKMDTVSSQQGTLFAPIDMATIKKWEMDDSMQDTKDFKRYLRWAAVTLQLILLGVLLAGGAALTVGLRVARDSWFNAARDEPSTLSLNSAVMFAIAEAGRSMAFQIVGVHALAILEPLDAAVFLVASARDNWQSAKQSLYDLINDNMVLFYVSLTATFGDPRDFSWPAQCYMDDCMMDLQVNLWALVLSKVILPMAFELFWTQVRLISKRQALHKRTATDQHKTTPASVTSASGQKAGGGANGFGAGGAPYVVSQSEQERKLPKFKGVHGQYQQLCPLIGIIVIFGCSAPASIALLLALIQMKLKYDCYCVLRRTQRPCVRRAKDTGTCGTYLHIITTMANVLIPTLLIFVFTDISRELLGPPDCPIQYVCFHDDENVLRYNSTVAALRWRVHASDSNKHWLTWTALVCMGLSLRVAMSILWRNPSYFIRAMTNEERFVQLKQGMLVKTQDTDQLALNLEEYNMSYSVQRAHIEELREKAKDIDTFDDWAHIRQRVNTLSKGRA